MVLEARNIFFRYGRQQPWLLKDFSLRLDRGERLSLLGPSGCGKSTLAMLLAGYLQPERGEILLDGQLLPQKRCCPVQLISQHPEQAINPRWRLRQVLEECPLQQEDLLPRLGIEVAWLDRFPRELSGGELQRFCVVRALLSGAPYLICDEISTMLDAISQAQIWQLLLREAEERKLGLIAISHNPQLAARISERVLDLSCLQQEG
ncbi:MAG: ATP-binding cassette domain-containing protein [Bacillota bacterium]|nr:ATP-binding cassette domain-containing protein [Bacillota bacterium]